MRHLILIKHSLPAIEPTLPAKQWPLSPEGHQRCSTLTTLLTHYTPTLIVSSPERKAQQTAAHLSLAFHQPYHVSEGLHEHERSKTGFLPQTHFEQIMDTFFSQPDSIVFGSESAHQARTRFSFAIEQALQEAPGGDVFVIAHGTVITLFVSYHTTLAPLPL
jgi:broad specificity phosphatase PhoE